jgi:elongation factor G
VIVKVEPNGRGKGIEIVNDMLGDAIPAEYIKHVTRGVREALDGGVAIGHPAVDGHPVVDIVVRVIDGSFHETDSSELAFTMAGIFAVKDAVKKAAPIAIK